VLLGLLRTPLRWAGAALLAISMIWIVAVPQPDALISGDGRNVAVRGRDGRLHLMKTAKDAFLVREWLAADADGRDATDVSLGDGVSCDDEGCVAPLSDGRLIALSQKPDGLTDDCAKAALIVTARPAPPGCQATVIELKRLRTHGAMALRWTKHGLVSDAVKPRGVSRPWSPSAGDAETDRALAARGASVRPADATPPEAELPSED
jgi:competence protein ComEC